VDKYASNETEEDFGIYCGAALIVVIPIVFMLIGFVISKLML
jgi:hypothetical protein